MIDLHMHTNYSDGTDSVVELLQNAEIANLEIISITDHNTAKAYEELEKIDIAKFYSGKIIPGIEINTKVLGVPIEILGYGIDYKKMNEKISTIFLPVEKRNKIEAERLFEKCVRAGIKFEDNCLDNYDGKYFASKFIMSEMQKFEENKNIIDKDAWGELRIFYRKYMSDPNGFLYINTDDLVPNFEVAANLIRECGGLVFVPHIYEYRENSHKILEYIMENYEVDGFECFYTTFEEEQTKEITEICRDKNFYMSGGSDYHGKAKPNVKIGIGEGNLKISYENMKEWLGKVKYLQ